MGIVEAVDGGTTLAAVLCTLNVRAIASMTSGLPSSDGIDSIKHISYSVEGVSMEVSPETNVRYVVHAGESYEGKQGPNYTPGVSAESVGAHALWLGSVTLPPGGRTKAHIHEHHESAFYMVSGDEAELWTGDDLQQREVVRTGDYLYVPAGVPHVAVNRSETPAVFIGARTDPNEQESVLMRPELDARVP